MLQDLVLKFLLASALGGLVGLEREWWREVEKKKYIIGIRTSILISIFGFLSYLISIYMFLIGMGITFAMGLVAYLIRTRYERRVGLTTFTAMLIVYLIGGLAIYNQLFATIITIIIVAILFFRRKLHRWIEEISVEEIKSAVEFLIISLVILPLLPNKTIDPFHLFNPFQFWYIVVLISAIGFVSYVFLKKYSKKGIFYSGIFGGFINSAATSFLISKFKKFHSGVFSAIAASIVSDIVGIIIVGNLNILVYTLPAQLFAIFSFMALGWFYSKGKVKLKIKSPLAIIPSLEFAALLFALIVLSALLKRFEIGLLILIIVASLYTSTAMTISIAIMNLNGALPTIYSARLIILATAICMLSKNLWIIKGEKKGRKKVLIWTLLISFIFGILGVIA